MRVQSIGQYEAVISVSADDCRALTEACEIAADVIGSDGERRGDVAFVEALGAAFKSLTVAGLAQWEMDHTAIDALKDTMKQLGW